MDPVVGFLLAFIIVREAMHQFTTQKLVNKLMSRNYHEYEAGKEVYKPKIKLPRQDELAEDLGVLGDSTLM